MKTFSSSLHKVRVLIVDDSAFARRTLTKILEHDPRIDVIGTAWDGQESDRKNFSTLTGCRDDGYQHAEDERHRSIGHHHAGNAAAGDLLSVLSIKTSSKKPWKHWNMGPWTLS